MKSDWYVQAEDGAIEGPLSDAALKHLADDSKVRPTSMIRKGTDGNWVAASKVRGLFDSGPIPTGASKLAEDGVASGGSDKRRLTPCPDCGDPVSARAAFCPRCGCAFHVSRRDRYPALQGLAALNKLLAVLVPIFCFLAISFIAQSNMAGKGQQITSLIVYGVLLPLLLWGTAELIMLLIDIEANTRQPEGHVGPVSTSSTFLLHDDGENHALPRFSSDTGAVRVRVVFHSYLDRTAIAPRLEEVGFRELGKQSPLERFFSTGAVNALVGTIDAGRLQELARISFVKAVEPR